jgi:hypothetical protein
MFVFPLLSIPNPPLVCTLKYMQHLWNIWWHFNRVFFCCKPIMPKLLLQCAFFVNYVSPSMMICYNNFVPKKLMYCVSPKLWILNLQGKRICALFQSMPITCYSTNICKKYAKLYHNCFSCHLVVGVIVVSHS